MAIIGVHLDILSLRETSLGINMVDKMEFLQNLLGLCHSSSLITRGNCIRKEIGIIQIWDVVQHVDIKHMQKIIVTNR